jgi:hypothetical protein
VGDLSPKVDVTNLAIRSVAGSLPILGPFLTEVLPNAQLARIYEFCERLEGRLETLEDAAGVRRRLDEPTFMGLLEDGVRLVARTSSADIREHVVSIVVDGLSADAARAVSRQHLLKLIEELNDVEMLMLAAAAKTGSDHDEFWRQHEMVLAAPLEYLDDEQADRAAIFESYYAHLQRLGLVLTHRNQHALENAPVREQIGLARELTPLGGVLLRTIGVGPGRTPAPSRSRAEKPTSATLEAYLKEFRQALAEHLEPHRAKLETLQGRLLLGHQTHDYRAVLEIEGSPVFQVQGLLHPGEAWLWAEYVTGGSRGPKHGRPILVSLGQDSKGVYWEFEGKRRTSLRQLAGLIAQPLVEAIKAIPL